jgi:hypothetical protein
VRILDLSAKVEGDVTDAFVDYSYEANRALIAAAFAKVDFLARMPRAMVEVAARHPERSRCVEPR